MPYPDNYAADLAPDGYISDADEQRERVQEELRDAARRIAVEDIQAACTDHLCGLLEATEPEAREAIREIVWDAMWDALESAHKQLTARADA